MDICTNLDLPETPASAVRQAAMTSRLKILVVEDDADIRRLNLRILTNSGYQVTAVEDGAFAWDALQLDNYDLLITDNSMPRVTGIELLGKLHAAHLILPVIMASGTLPQEELDRRPWLIINATLLKPYSFDELLRTVKNILHASAGTGEPAVSSHNQQDRTLSTAGNQ